MKVLIISDGRPGHENQSIAFCKLLNYEYVINHVSFKNRVIKLAGYLFDWLGIYTKALFSYNKMDVRQYDFIVSCGSSTYYPAKYFAKTYDSRVIALMYPKGYKNNFFHIFSGSYDNPKKANNVTILPINISYVQPKRVYIPKKKSVGVIIGGSNTAFKLEKESLQRVLQEIKKQFCDYEIAITTSPRTPKDIEEMIEKESFDYEAIYSKTKINPISDFIFSCEYIFITQDSTSMISEAVSGGNANIEIIPLISKKKDSKFKDFIDNLITLNVLHLYDGVVSHKNAKIDLKEILRGAIK